jgi:hypothetical protein
MRDRRHPPHRRVLLAVTAVWLAATVGGLAVMAAYANRPGAPAQPPAHWPAASRLPRDSSRPVLLVLAHPRCDCTRATIAELAELMARARQRPQAFVLFIKPAGTTENWEQTDLWQRASGIPSVSVVRDDNGVEAARFGAVTSGQALLYDAAGSLRFEGGTTAARGHVGENPGVDALLALLGGETPRLTNTPVYGCGLMTPDEARQAKEKADDGA